MIKYGFNLVNLIPEISARNVLKGKVKKVTHGAINSEAIVELPEGIEIASIITKASAERLGLKEGREVSATIKATNLMLVIGF
ncbi:MAG: molybdopterin-binding protein [Candidatus Hodarchaeota archaeon]